MFELTGDPFYAQIAKYDRCVVEYCLIGDDAPHRGKRSHYDAVLFAMLRVIERWIDEDGRDFIRFGDAAGAEPFHWKLDMEKAKAVPIDPAELLFAPEILRIDRNGTVFYNCAWEPNDENFGGQIPYWYAFLEPPHSSGHVPADFRKVNSVLFPAGADALEVYQWTTDWSNYFDAGHEWWGAACWSVYDRRMKRYAVLFASATD